MGLLRNIYYKISHSKLNLGSFFKKLIFSLKQPKTVAILVSALFIAILGGIIFRNQIATFFSNTGAEPIVYYSFNEGVGTTVNDSSSSNIDAPIGHDISGPAPSFVGINTMVSTATGSTSVPVPAAYQEGDLLIIFAESANQDIANPDGWTEISSSPQGQGGGGVANAVRLEIYYKFATASESSVSITDPADHVVGIMAAFRNVDTTNPINVSVGDTSTGAIGTMTLPAVTTTIPNTLIVHAIANDTDEDDFSNVNSWTNAGLTSITERFDQNHNDGQGGGISMATGIMATAGNTGNTIADGDNSDERAFITFALSSVNGWGGYPTWKPETECINGTCLYFDGSEDAITVGNTDPIDFDSGLSSDFTISTWVRTLSAGVGETGQIFAKGNNTFLQVINEGSDGYADLQASVDLATTDATVSIVNGIELQKWQHISLVYADDADDEIEVYIDGVLRGTSTNGSGAPATSDDSDILIGGSIGYFHGYIDQFKIYDYNQNTSQVKANVASRGSTKGVAAQFGDADIGRKLSNGLIGYWNMDAGTGTTITDMSGNNKTGTFGSGGSAPAWTSGKYGSGLVFDGTDDRVSTNLSVGYTTYSISAWINYSDNTYGDIIGKESEKEFYVNGVDNTFGIGHFYTSGVKYWESPTNSLSKNTWHHVMVTHSATPSSNSPTLYIDGIAQELTVVFNNSSGVATTNSNAVSIGSWNGTNNSAALMYKGTMDEVRMYNRVLDSSEVKALYQWAPGPVGYWKMDEANGTSIFDSSGNGNNSSAWNGNTTWVKGKFGTATYHDGNGDRITIPSASNLDYQSSYTWTFWINPTSGSYQIIDKSVDTNNGWTLNTNGSKYQLTINYTGTDLSCNVSAATMSENEWQYITWTWDGTSSCTGVKFYKNGNLISFESTTSSTGSRENDTDKDILIGGNGYTDFTGKLDDIKIYNYARTASEIIQDMNAGHPVVGTPVGSTVLHLKMNEGYGNTLNDSSPQGNDGTIAGTSAPSWTNNGKFGKALQFDGTDDYVTLPGNLSYGTSDSWSASLWLKEEPGDSDWSFFLGEKGTNGEGILFRSTTNLLQFRGSDLSYVGGPAVDRDQWNHAVVTYSSGTIYMYLNGTQYGPYTLASTMDFTGIGYAYGGDHYFRGSIDEVKIYPFALTEDEVKVDYNAGKSFILGSSSTGVGGTSPSNSASREYCVPGDTTTCSEPVAEWKFDEGTGTSSFDTSNNENTGTLTNGPLWKIGKFGKAVFFDGASGLDQNDAIIAGTGTSISNIFDGGGSVSFWVKPASTGEANGHFLNKSSNSTGWFLQPQSCDSTRIDFQMRTPTAGTQSQWRADCALNLNQWNHVVVLYNDDAVSNDPSFYINGKLVALTLDTNADSAYGSDASNFFGIGNNAVANETVDGLIDEVRMYDYLRSPAQIAWEYNRGKPVAYYDMNDCTGTTVYNSARNGNNKSTGSDGSISLGSSGVTTAGTCTTSGAWANGAVGKFGSSFSFDGSDDYIDIGSSSLFDFGDNNFSINMWAKVDRDAFMSLLGKWGASDRSWYLRYNATTDRFEFYMSSDGTSSSAIACSPGSDIVTGQWYMVTAMFDAVNNRKYCYTDATKSQITAGYNSQSAYNDGNNNVVIGALYVGNEQFDGQLDELQFFNYVLTKEQRMLLYNNGGAVRFE